MRYLLKMSCRYWAYVVVNSAASQPKCRRTCIVCFLEIRGNFSLSHANRLSNDSAMKVALDGSIDEVSCISIHVTEHKQQQLKQHRRLKSS